MAYIRYNKLWESDFHKNVSAKDKVKDIYLNQIKLKIPIPIRYKKQYLQER